MNYRFFDTKLYELNCGDAVVYTYGERLYVGTVVEFDLTAANCFRVKLLSTEKYEHHVYGGLISTKPDIVKFSNLFSVKDIQYTSDVIALSKALVPSTLVFKDKTIKGKDLTYDELVEYFIKRLKPNQLSASITLSDGVRYGIRVSSVPNYSYVSYNGKKSYATLVSNARYENNYEGKNLLKDPRLLQHIKDW